MKDRPIIGILGGMGTAAGIHFQKLFFKTCSENGVKGDQDYPEWIYFNASKTPDRTEALLQTGPSPVDYLVDSMKRMQAAGVEVVVAVCNTVHSFYKPVFEQVPIPWINLQIETAKVIEQAGYSSVALISTEGTLRSGLFKNAIEPLGIDYFEPDPGSELQQKITNAIYHPSYGIKFTGSNISAEAVELLQSAADQFDSEAIIAGCTEISLAETSLKISAAWLDPLKIAAEACFNYWVSK
jgi:aspartate racemase